MDWLDSIATEIHMKNNNQPSKHTDLPIHIPNPEHLRVRAICTKTGAAITGQLLLLDTLAFVVHNGVLHQVQNDTIQPYVPSVGAYVGDSLCGAERGEFGQILSTWTGTLVWDEKSEKPVVYDDDDSTPYDPDDYTFDRVQSALSEKTSETEEFTMLTATMVLMNAIQSGLQLQTAYAESDALQYGYTIRSCTRKFFGKPAYRFSIGVHTANRTGISCRDGDIATVTVYADKNIVVEQPE